MFYLVLFCKFLITNGCGIVFGRQGPEVHKIAGSDFGPQSDPQGEAQGCAELILLTPTNNYILTSDSLIQGSSLS